MMRAATSKLAPKGPLQHSRAARGEGGGLAMVALAGVEQMIRQSLYNPRTIKYVRNSSKSMLASFIKERRRPFLSSG